MSATTRFPTAALLVPTLLFGHPADTNTDNQISEVELLTYASAAPDNDLLQQAENIWKHGGP